VGLYYPEDDYLPIGEGGIGGRSGSSSAIVKQCLRSLLSVPYSVRFGSAETTGPPFGGGRLLEIGCGHGIYLTNMRRLGWDVYGCDISRRKVDRLKREIGDDHIFFGRIEDLSFAPASFDLIALWHVIEHLHDPGAALERMRALLRPGGQLILGTPNVESLEARVFGRWWSGFDVPRHLVVFSRRALEQLLVNRGFRVSRTRPSLWSYSVPDSLALYLNCRGRFRFWGGRAHRWMHHMLYPWVALSRTLGNWAILEVTAVKDDASLTN
jgi:SAM-dependent methyltransferase